MCTRNRREILMKICGLRNLCIFQEYLSAKSFVHRDLAARNVLVGDKKIVKLADFGLTRHLYEDVYQMKEKKKMPIKWMPPEALQDLVFTTQSDM